MAILDTLYIIFKGNSDQLKQTEKDVQKENDKTVTSMEKVDKATAKMGESFLGVARSVVGLGAGLLTFGTLLNGFRNTVNYSAQLDQASRALGVNTEQLDLWDNAIRNSGGTLEGFQSSIRNLAGHLGTTASTAFKILPQLADSFQRLGRFRALNYGKMLGLDEPTILLLMRGRREVDALLARQKELGLITKNQAELSRKLSIELGDTGQAFRALYATVGETIIPILNKFLVVIQDVVISLRKHKDFVIGALIAIAGGAAIAAVAFGLLTAPILLTVAAIGLFALAYEDLAVFFKGGDSLIGRAEKRWPRAFLVIREAFNDLRKTFEWLKNFKFSDIGNGILDNFIKNSPELRRKLEAAQKGNTAISAANTNPFNSPISNFTSIFGTRSSAGNTVTIGEININTAATDVSGISLDIRKTITDHFNHATTQFDDGRVA